MLFFDGVHALRFVNLIHESPSLCEVLSSAGGVILGKTKPKTVPLASAK